MGAASWAIPVGVLGGIVVLSFIFVWFWFPRAWQKGVNADTAEIDGAQGLDRDEQRRKNREVIERFTKARARERGEAVDDDVELGHRSAEGVSHMPPRAYTAAKEGTQESAVAEGLRQEPATVR